MKCFPPGISVSSARRSPASRRPYFAFWKRSAAPHTTAAGALRVGSRSAISSVSSARSERICRTNAAGPRVARPVGLDRLARALAVVVPLVDEKREEPPEEAEWHTPHEAPDRAHGLYRWNRPGVVCDRVAEHHPTHPFGPADRRDLGHSSTEVMTYQQRPLDPNHVEPAEEVAGLSLTEMSRPTPCDHDRPNPTISQASRRAPGMSGSTWRHSSGDVGMPWIRTTGRPSPVSSHRNSSASSASLARRSLIASLYPARTEDLLCRMERPRRRLPPAGGASLRRCDLALS